MAEEILINLQAFLTNGLLTDSFNQGALLFTQNVAKLQTRTLSITTSEAAFTFTDIATYGWALLYNLSSAASVIHGPTSGTLVNYGLMGPGEPALFRLYPGIAIRMKTVTGSASVLATIWND